MANTAPPMTVLEVKKIFQPGLHFVGARCLELTILAACRSGEAPLAAWSESIRSRPSGPFLRPV